MSLLNRIAQTMTTVTDLPPALEEVAEILAELFHVQATIINVLDADNSEVGVLAHYGHTQIIRSSDDQLFPVSASKLTRQFFAAGEVTVIGSKEFSSVAPSVARNLNARNIKTVMLAPLISRGEIIGILGVGTSQSDRIFQEHELRLAQTVTGYIASAIETARLFRQEQRQKQVAESLTKVASALTSSLDQDTVLNTIFEQLGQVIPFDGACISLLESDELVMTNAVGISRRQVGRRVLLSDLSLLPEILKSGQPTLILDTRKDPDGWYGMMVLRFVAGWARRPLSKHKFC